jgi:hypothetical protein
MTFQYKSLWAAAWCIALVFSSCASKKELAQTNADLNLTKKKLDSTSLSNKNLNTEVSLLKVTQDMRLKEISSEQKNKEYKIYKNALACYDYVLAAQQMARLSEIDTANRAVYYDSLALYHFFYLMDPNSMRPNNAAYYYTQKGLKLNPNNEFLLEIKGKLDLEEHRDTMALAGFSRLYKKTGDYTYLYEITFIQLALNNNIKFTDSVINLVTKNIESEIKTVRLDYLQEKFRQEVPAKAAFLYLRAVIQNGVQGNKIKAMKTLEDILKIAPDFYYAKGMLEQLKNPQRSQQQGSRPY